jgi:hypothetical protein
MGMVPILMRLFFTEATMYYVRTIIPTESTQEEYDDTQEEHTYETMMEDYTIDDLIQKFIKTCVEVVGGENHLLEVFFFPPNEDSMVGWFIICQNDENIGCMAWGESAYTHKAVLGVKRKDRGDNTYFYSPQGKLLRYGAHT